MQGSVVMVGANFRTWVSAVRHLYGLLAVGIWTPTAAVAAPSPQRYAPPYPQPPYLETNVGGYMVSLFEADRSTIQSLLPPDVEAAASNTVGVSHYVVGNNPGAEVGSGAVLAPFQATYVFAEVEGRDDPSGGKGRHVLWGLYSQDLVVATLGDILGLPMRVGTTVFTEKGAVLQGSGISEDDQIIVSGIRPKGDGPVTLGGVLHYPSIRHKAVTDAMQTPSPELLIQPIAWTASVLMADLVSMKLNFPENHPLKGLEPRKLLYAYYGRDVSFAFGDTPRVCRR